MGESKSKVVSLNLSDENKVIFNGKEFRVDKRYIKPSLDGSVVLQSDSPSLPIGEWEVCQSIVVKRRDK